MARLCAATLPLRGMRRQADCIRGFSFSLSLARSLTHPSTLVRLLPRPLFALFLSLRLIFFSLSWLLLSSLVRLPPSSPSQSLSLSLSLSLPLPTPVRCGPHARASPARDTQHTWPVGHSYLRSVRSYLLQGTVSRGPQAATARSAQHGLCSLVSRAHDTSQRRTERPDRQIVFSLPGSACGAFSLPLFLRFFLSLSLYPFLFLFPSHSHPVLQPSPLFLPFRPPVLRPRCARDVITLWDRSRAPPRRAI